MPKGTIYPDMIRLFFLCSLFSVSNLVFGQERMKQGSPEKPNVILIYVDDLGFGDLSSYGASSIKTPHTDRIAKNGLRFTNGHSTSATCTPSRYALMTGEYPWRKKGHSILPGDAALIIPTSTLTLPKVFKELGYHTGIVGKWHLGLGNQINKDWNTTIKPGPNEVGFDYSFIFPATADRVPTVFMENGRVTGLDPLDSIFVDYKKKVGNEPTGKENPELLKLASSLGHNQTIVNGIGRIGFMQGGKKTRWTDEELAGTFLLKAENFIDANKDKPFFLFYPMHNIHVPRMPGTIFKGKSKLGYRGDAILEMDWVVGQLYKQLDQLGLTDNTIIIFTSDNGPVLDDGYADQAVVMNGDHKPAGPYRGWKTSAYEGGTRVPFIISWPKKIKPGVSNAMVSQMDFIASFASFFKINIPKYELKDSEDILEALLGNTQSGRSTMVREGYGNLAIVKNDWKYIPAHGKLKDELYDLSHDPGEKQDLADKHPEKISELSALLNAIKSE